MNTGAKVGLAVVAGYVLGRYRKGKWALALAATGAGMKLPGPQGAVLEQGKKLLSSNPVVGHLTQEVRDQLVGVGRTALTSTVSRRIDSVSDALRERSDLMRGTGGRTADAEDGEESGKEESGERPTRRRASPSSKASGSGSTSKPRSTSTARSTSKPRSTSTARSTSSGRSSGSRSSTSAAPRKRAASSGQEARPRRRSAAGSGQEKAPTGRKRSGSSSGKS